METFLCVNGFLETSCCFWTSSLNVNYPRWIVETEENNSRNLFFLYENYKKKSLIYSSLSFERPGSTSLQYKCPTVQSLLQYFLFLLFRHTRVILFCMILVSTKHHQRGSPNKRLILTHTHTHTPRLLLVAYLLSFWSCGNPEKHFAQK